MIGGDSAGGNLAAALLLHLGHPHPQLPAYRLSHPLRGALLISPWISFNTDLPSFTKNQYSDYLTATAIKRASEAFVGPDKQHDSYSEPSTAPREWWKEVATSAVTEVLIWGGGGEVLIDSIRTFGERVIEGFGMADDEQSSGKMTASKTNGAVEELTTGPKPTEQALKENNSTVKNITGNDKEQSGVTTEVGSEAPVETHPAVQDATKEPNSTGVEASTEVKDFAEDVPEEAPGTIESIPQGTNDAVEKVSSPMNAAILPTIPESPSKPSEVERAPAATNAAVPVLITDPPSKPSEVKKSSRATLVITPHEAHEEMIMDYILLISKKGDGAKEIENWMTKTLKG
jgi:hypothetical protein